jgi:tetratricopeptide (TPR) repeat protein
VNEAKNIMGIACRGNAWTVAALVLLLGAAVPAQAQEQARQQTTPATQVAQDSTTDDFPWGQGVPDADRDRAIAIFLEANVLLEDTLFGRAAAKYEEALKLWDHPAFHYNLALARIHLDQPIAAYENLEQAVRYGPEPLNSQDRYEHARRYLELLRNQLAHVEVTCDEPGAKVTLDGKPLFTAPGRQQVLVLPGGHQIVASAPDRIPVTEQPVLAPGQQATVALVLQRPARTVTERYMPAWIPWASLGLGAAVLGVGGYFDRASNRSLTAFDGLVTERCPRGCTPEIAPELAPRHASAERERHAALGFYLAGGVVLAGSAALLYINRERVVSRATDESSVSFQPWLAPDSAGIAAQGRF